MLCDLALSLGFLLVSLPLYSFTEKKFNSFFGLKYQQARIWDYFNKRKQAILVASNQTLEESNLQMDQDVSTLENASICE